MSEGRTDKLELQPDAKLAPAQSYSVSQLLCYHDEVFVKNLYLALLGREATNIEFETTLRELRSGDHTKVELIESLLDSHKVTLSKVSGLSSPSLKKVRTWPVLGYWVRILRSITRLPQLMHDQQRFEVYALAQQQRIADFINKQVVPAISSDSTSLQDYPSTVASVRDAVEGVIMLSDSMLELAEKQHQSEEQQELLTNGIQEVQKQLETSERRIHQTMATLTESIRELQSQLETLRVDVDQKLDSPKQFLVQEQRVIVEAQKLALDNIETRVTQTIQTEVRALRDAIAQLNAEMQNLATHQESATAKELERA